MDTKPRRPRSHHPSLAKYLSDVGTAYQAASTQTAAPPKRPTRMPPRLRCNYVNAEMIYDEAECTPSEAIALLSQVMQPEMTQRLLDEPFPATNDANQPPPPTMPAYLLVATFPDGEATLNLYCNPSGWEHIWVLSKPRFKWLPAPSKTVTTEPAPATLEALSASIAQTSAASVDQLFKTLRPTAKP
jgi:hypothetical protein